MRLPADDANFLSAPNVAVDAPQHEVETLSVARPVALETDFSSFGPFGRRILNYD